MNPRFYFATCQVGAEKPLKTEVLAKHPQLRFAFSRPGFITFKEEDDKKPLITSFQGVFARLWGVSVGQAKDQDALLKLIESIPEKSIVHAFARDLYVPGDEPDLFVTNAKIIEVVKNIPEEIKSKLRWYEVPKLNEKVYDLIWIDDFHVFLGTHIHLPHLDGAPGNQPQINLPAGVPSRAYLKISEAIHRFKPEYEKGMQVLEIGCSPGGASMAMLKLGLRVMGIDPKRMDNSLYDEPHFAFIQKMAINIVEPDLQVVNPDWIVMDMNIAPLEAIDELAHIIKCLRKNFGTQLKVKKGFLTIKLNDWKFADNIPLYLKRITECGFKDLTAVQLCSNRQEFFVYAKNFK